MNINHRVHNSINAINQAVELLSREGFIIIGFYHDSQSKPTVEIDYAPKCNTYITIGQAIYYRHEGYYRFGQFELEGCRIIWKERNIRRLL